MRGMTATFHRPKSQSMRHSKKQSCEPSRKEIQDHKLYQSCTNSSPAALLLEQPLRADQIGPQARGPVAT